MSEIINTDTQDEPNKVPLPKAENPDGNNQNSNINNKSTNENENKENTEKKEEYQLNDVSSDVKTQEVLPQQNSKETLPTISNENENGEEKSEDSIQTIHNPNLTENCDILSISTNNDQNASENIPKNSVITNINSALPCVPMKQNLQQNTSNNQPQNSTGSNTILSNANSANNGIPNITNNVDKDEIYKLCIEYSNAASEQLKRDYDAIQNGTSPVYKNYLTSLDVAKNRLKATAELQHTLTVRHADRQLEFMMRQIENDYMVGCDDVRQKMLADLRKVWKDRKLFVEKLANEHGFKLPSNCFIEPPRTIAGKKRNINTNAQIRRGKMKGAVRDDYNFRLSENEVKQNISLINNIVTNSIPSN